MTVDCRIYIHCHVAQIYLLLFLKKNKTKTTIKSLQLLQAIGIIVTLKSQNVKNSRARILKPRIQNLRNNIKNNNKQNKEIQLATQLDQFLENTLRS